VRVGVGASFSVEASSFAWQLATKYMTHARLHTYPPTPPISRTHTQLYALWPKGTCADLGLSGKTNVTITEMVSAMVNVSNTPATARVLNNQLKSLMATGTNATSGSADASSALSMVTGLSMNCTDVQTAFIQSAAEINRQLYCGYYQSRCAEGKGPQQLTAAFDWKATNGRRFEPEMYYNDTYGLATSTQATVYQRIPQVFNLAVNGWMRTFVGEWWQQQQEQHEEGGCGLVCSG